MKQQVIYRYLGTNGVIESPVHLEGIYSVRLVTLIADKNKVLTDGTKKVKSIKVPEEEASEWREVYITGQN